MIRCMLRRGRLWPLACAVVSLVALVGAAADGETTARVELRRAETEAAPGLVEMRLDGDDGRIFVHSKAELTNADIASASVVEVRGSLAVDVTLSDEGSEKMARLSTEHLHKRLAILVDGKIVCAPRINSQIRKQVQITGRFSRAEAERIAKGLSGKPST